MSRLWNCYPSRPPRLDVTQVAQLNDIVVERSEFEALVDKWVAAQ